ncbi:MAG: cation-transporting P-type ATPase, partial [Burkholderiales bacterium]
MRTAELPDSRPDPSLVDPQALGIDLVHGLTPAEAARRLGQDGPNELRHKPPVRAWRRLVGQLRDPLIYLLLAAIAISLIAWFIEGAHGVPIDALVIALIVVLNAVLGFVQEARAESAVAALARMTAVTSAVIRDGNP